MWGFFAGSFWLSHRCNAVFAMFFCRSVLLVLSGRTVFVFFLLILASSFKKIYIEITRKKKATASQSWHYEMGNLELAETDKKLPRISFGGGINRTSILTEVAILVRTLWTSWRMSGAHAMSGYTCAIFMKVKAFVFVFLSNY